MSENINECTHIYGYSHLFDHLTESLEDDQRCLNDKNQKPYSTYEYWLFNYCPECGKKLERDKK